MPEIDLNAFFVFSSNSSKSFYTNTDKYSAHLSDPKKYNTILKIVQEERIEEKI